MSKHVNYNDELIDFKVGDEVYWHDPDFDADGPCSGNYTIQTLYPYHVYLVNEAGSECEAFYCELS